MSKNVVSPPVHETEEVQTVALAPARHEPRTRRPAEEREAQIIDAAFEAFGVDGLNETRIDDVARIAGVSKGTIYLYFPNKEALFREMILRTVIARLDALENEAHDPDPLTDFHRLVGAFWGYINTSEFPVIHRLVIGALPRMPELSQFFAERASLRWQRLLQTSIDACVNDGTFSPEHAPRSACMLHSMLMQHALMRALPSMCTAMKLDDGDAVLEHILTFFLGVMQSTTPISRAQHA
jgi:AcrR family transcriptional regulator